MEVNFQRTRQTYAIVFLIIEIKQAVILAIKDFNEQEIYMNKMRKKNLGIVITFLSFIFIWMSAGAQEQQYQWKEAADGKYRYTYVENDPIKARFYKLQNGLTVILSPNKKEPRIKALIATKAGSKTDPKNNTGLAHYLEHMMFKGTDKFGTLDWSKEKPLLDKIEVLYEQYNSTKDELKRKEIYKEIDRISGEAAKYTIPNEYMTLMNNLGSQETNAFTSFEQTVYEEDIPRNVIDSYLAVQAERFRYPVFRLFHTELETVYEEKNISLDNDRNHARDVLFESLFAHHNYGQQTIIGTVAHLKNPSLKAIRSYYNAYYVPNNMAIIMSGDFDPSEMITKIDHAFSYMKAVPVPAYSFEKEQPIAQPIIKEVKGPNPELLYMGFRLPGAAHEDAQLLELVKNILSNGSAGMIDLDLVKAQKLLSAGAQAFVLKDYATLLFYGTPSEGQSLEDVQRLFLSTLDKLRKGEFSDDLITSIINNELKSQIDKSENYKDRARTLLSAFTTETDWAKELSFVNRMKTITKQDVIDFANKYLRNDNFVAVYKRQGAVEGTVKVEKPPITPITVNSDVQSTFVKKISDLQVEPIQPVWVDYEKSITKGQLKDIDIAAVKNSDNALFNLSYQFPIGNWNNKLIPLALGYLRFLGTNDKSSEEFSAAFYKLASKFSISVDAKETSISISGLDEHFDASLSLLHDLLQNCAVDEMVFESYRDRLKKNRSNAKENKGLILSGLGNYAKYGAQNPFNYVLSDSELAQLKATDLLQVLKDLTNINYQILYYGPRTMDQLINTLPTLKQGTHAFIPVASGINFKALPTAKNQVLFAPYEMKQVELLWFRNAAVYNSDQTPLVSVFNHYFGNGMGSLVFQNIRESKALAYSTYAVYEQPDREGDNYDIYAYIGTQADKLNDAIGSMNELLNTLPESPVALESARTSLIKSIASKRIANDEILYYYNAAKRLGNETDLRKDIYEEVPTLTFADLKTFHGKEFSNKPFIYCVVGSQESVSKEELAKIGEVKTLSLSDIFGY